MVPINLLLFSSIFTSFHHYYLTKMVQDPRSVYLPLPQQQCIVRLLVGPGQEEFIEPAATLSKTSLLEKANCATIVMEDEEVETVSAYLCFHRADIIHCKPPPQQQQRQPKKKQTPKELEEEEKRLAAEAHTLEYEKLAKLFCFGNRHKDIKFKTAVADAIYAKAYEKDTKGKRWPPTFKAVTSIFENTDPDAPIRKMLVGIFQGCDKETFSCVTADGSSVPFLLDVVAALVGQVEGYRKELKQPTALPQAEAYYEAQSKPS